MPMGVHFYWEQWVFWEDLMEYSFLAVILQIFTSIKAISLSNLALSADGTTAMVGDAIEDLAGGVRFFISSSPSLQTITFATPPASTYGSTTDIVPWCNKYKCRLPITYKSSDTTIATIVNNKIHPKAAGTTYITASQANTNIAPVMRPFTVNKAVLTIAVDNQTRRSATKNRAAGRPICRS